MAADPKPLQGIDTILLRVSNIERSKLWYSDKLGFGVLWYSPEQRLVVLDTGTPPSLTLWQTNAAIQINTAATPFPIFRTENAAHARDVLEKRGVAVSELIDDGIVVFFQFFDPDGNVLEACQVHP